MAHEKMICIFQVVVLRKLKHKSQYSVAIFIDNAPTEYILVRKVPVIKSKLFRICDKKQKKYDYIP